MVVLVSMAVLAAGCTPKPSEAVPSQTDFCSESNPIHVVIGLAGNGMSDAQRRTAIGSVSVELERLSVPGAPGLVVSVYPLSEQSLAAEAARLRTGCIPTVPDKPDLRNASNLDRQRLQQEFDNGQKRVRDRINQTRTAIERLRDDLKNRQPQRVPVDIWGFLTIASREFDSTPSSQRYVVIIARDEDITTTWCGDCVHLQDAKVIFLNFDQATPQQTVQRTDEWNLWLHLAGAGATSFFRSNEPIRGLFTLTRS